VLPHVDVVLESYRPGVMERLGLGPEVCHDVNPNLIFVRLSGYGQAESENRLAAGHDMNYLAMAGILDKFRRYKKQHPVFPNNILADFACGSLYCFNLIL
jgi:alpha-methylacyl-CoA racemase